MGYLDYTDEWLIELTRQRRLEREISQRSKPCLHYGGAKSIIKFAKARPDPVILRGMARRARRMIERGAKAQKYLLIFELQGRRCYLCAAPFACIETATDEHVVPKALGGRRVGNILHACADCNNRKANRPPHACEVLYLDAINRIIPRAHLRRACGAYVEIVPFVPLRRRWCPT